LKDLPRVVRFGAVGGSGVLVNTFFLWFFTDVAGLHYMASSPMAVELSVLSNFLLNDAWTFRESGNASSRLGRMLRFHATSAGGFAINYAFLIGLTELAGLHYLISNLAGILAAFAWNYTVNVRWTWREPPG
jgi:dolichol-phosphate mannosyltransferase